MALFTIIQKGGKQPGGGVDDLSYYEENDSNECTAKFRIVAKASETRNLEFIASRNNMKILDSNGDEALAFGFGTGNVTVNAGITEFTLEIYGYSSPSSSANTITSTLTCNLKTFFLAPIVTYDTEEIKLYHTAEVCQFQP